MSNLRSGIKIKGETFSARELDCLGDEPDLYEGAEKVAKIVYDRAVLIVGAGMETTLDIDDLSRFELEALAAARRKEDERHCNILAVMTAAAMREENLGKLVPDDLGVDVRNQKKKSAFQSKAMQIFLEGGYGG